MLAADGRPTVPSVGIRPNSSILTVLSHLNYKAWYAVAEFVDNSIQSYLSNRSILHKVHGLDFKLQIKIRLDAENKLLEITDNAAGIQAVDYPRAFRPAEIPPDRAGLSEFGMGMKTAACWFTHTWNVRSKALGEPVERLIRFDLEEIVDRQLESLPVTEYLAKPDAHFTVIRLENLGKKFPATRTQKKLRDHISSIYRIYLQGGEIEIYVDEDKLKFESPEILTTQPYDKLDSEPMTWHKKIEIELSGNRRVFGFAAIRREASTTHAGFALFRRNRLILGSDDESYRPMEIFGNSNSFRFQRLFGELHVEGFEVSHTKDGFRWDDVEDEFLQKLRDCMREGIDLLRQADNYRARPSKSTLEPVLTRAGSSMAADLMRTGGEVLSVIQEASVLTQPPPETSLLNDVAATNAKFSLLVDNQKWNVTVRTGVDPAINEWLRLGRVENFQLEGMLVREIIIDVSMAHPFVQKFIGPRNENAELFLRFAVGLALAAEKSGRAGYPSAVTMHWFNRLLRESLTGSVD